MAKIDKYMQGRLDGLARGLMIAQDEGIDTLRKEVNFRKAFPFQLEISKQKADEIFEEVITKMYGTYVTVCYQAVHETFGAGKIRLKRFKDNFNRHVIYIHTLDEFGFQYSTFTEMAQELNRKYDLDIDMEHVEEIQDKNDAHAGLMRARITSIVGLLEDYADKEGEGLRQAADFLRRFFPEAFA